MKLFTANKISIAIIAGVFALNYCMPANAKASQQLIDSDIVEVNFNNTHVYSAKDVRATCIDVKTVLTGLSDERNAYSYAYSKVAYGSSESMSDFLIAAQVAVNLCKNLNRTDRDNFIAMGKGTAAGQGTVILADHIEVLKKNGAIQVIYDVNNDARPYRQRLLDQAIEQKEEAKREEKRVESERQEVAAREHSRLDERKSYCQDLQKQIDSFNPVAWLLIKDKQWDLKKMKMQYAKSCGSDTSVESGEELGLKDYINFAKAGD